ncbi:MAG: hypothetical protein DWH78_00830 [Planctomycetota bacterium]|nr:MAG: hypothetical protein DWH78_00830 [Planctomycetota bacterium]
MNGQPILSIADVQWVLHRTPASGGKIQLRIVRGDSDQVVTLELAEGWRRLDDISWRASSWGLRRMVTGGLVLVSLSVEERKTLELPAGGMALRIKHVGQYGAHAAGKNAGF